MVPSFLMLTLPSVALAGVELSSSAISIPTKVIAAGVHMPVLSIGTGGLESDQTRDIVTHWMQNGGRAVDTAYQYENQDVIAKAISDAGVDRKDVFITSKVPGCSNTTSYVEQNLKQLSTNYIDLLLIHWWDTSDAACASAWATLEDFHAQGVLKSIGVSNFNVSNLESLLKTAKVVPAINQVQLNILEHDDETMEYSENHGIVIEAYSPLGRGGHSGNIPGHPVIQQVAAAHNVSTYQVALKWILQHDRVLTFQSTSKEHQANDADLFGFELTSDEMVTLNKLQRTQYVVV